MKYCMIVKVLLCLSCGLLSTLFAAEYREGELWLEVLLASGTQLEIGTLDGANPVLTVSEQDSPISRTLTGPLSIQLLAEENLALWGFLNRIEPWTGQAGGVLREYFAWQDTLLVIRRERQVFEETTFQIWDAARRHAQETGIPEQQIKSIPILNSRVKIKAQDGSEHYFETPLHLHCDTPVTFGGVQLGYEGDFVLKTVGARIVVNHLLPLEDYVAGVIQNEIGNNAPAEALKAQAVAARTHAVSLLLYNRHTADGYDLCNTTHCQVYKGKHLLNDAVLAAVLDTRGEILLAEGRVADATYHSACGGKTDSSASIWNGAPVGHLSGSTCIAEAQEWDLSREPLARRWIDTPLAFEGASSWERAALSWEKSITRQALAANLGLNYVNRIVINKRGSSGRITDMSFLGPRTVRLTSEYKIRQAFGSARSSFFYIRGAYTLRPDGSAEIIPGANLLIKGRGSGHGVGLCQVGTLRRARAGEDYRSILGLYYPGTRIAANWMVDEN